jgi:hypothetical protein
MKKILHKIGQVSLRTWLYLFIASSLICIFGLRHNNQQMIKLRDGVYAADKKNSDVNAALNNLRSYVYGHMNTGLSSGNNNIKPPIQLKYTYQRLYEAEVSQIQDANQKIYTDAQNYCQSINNAYFGTTRVPCVQNYVSTHGIRSTDNVTIPAGLYEFDFVSPTWSPDLAGWTLVTTFVLLVALLVKLGTTKYANKK